MVASRESRQRRDYHSACRTDGTGTTNGRLAVSAIYFTLAGIVLYLAADWLLERIEVHRGERLEHRTLVFFGILLGLALATFPLLQSLLE